MVPFLAFSLQDQVEKYGAYVGIAAFFGLAVLTILYFAQARELRRLRDWAGRAPERAQEIEARAMAQAEAARSAQVKVQQRTPAPATAGGQATQVVEPVEGGTQSDNGTAAAASEAGNAPPVDADAGDGKAPGTNGAKAAAAGATAAAV